MKNEENRIWNKSELEKMPDWEEDSLDNWHHKSIEPWIVESMIGKSVQWCEDQGLTVTPEMIAKPIMEVKLDCAPFNKETELVQEAVTQMNEKLKERLDKGEIGITLENGTTLKVGEKYRLSGWDKNEFCKIEFFGDRLFIAKSRNDYEEAWRINDNWLPYTEPKTDTEILQKAIKQLDNMTPEEVQQRSKDRGIVIPDEPKTAIAANGTELVVGGRYRLEFWNKDDFFQILFIGEKAIFVKPENGYEASYLINNNWIPYTDPKEEPKPIEGYQKWYVLNNNIIQTVYAEKKEEILKSLIGVIVYSEQEVIDLGLKL